MKMKKLSSRYDINRLRSRHEGRYTKYKISNTSKGNSRLKLAKKIKQKLSNTLTLNFCYFKIICFLHPHLSSKNNRAYSNILKCVCQVCLFQGENVNYNENENEIRIIQIRHKIENKIENKQKICNTFMSNNRLKLVKNQAKAKSYTLRLNICCLKIICSLHPRLSSKSNRAYSKKCAKKKVCLFY